MHRLHHSLIIALAVGILPGARAATESPAQPPAIPVPVAAALAQTHIPAGALSAVVRDIHSGETLLAVNAEVARSPASTIKVVTTFGALDELGPNYVWTTRAYATGPIVAGHLKGDLVLRGGGDPFMSAERWERFAREVRLRGITHVDGDVVIDETLFEAQDADPDDFDGKGYRTYNVLPAALLVNLQTVEFHVVPEQGHLAVIADPAPANFTITNHLKPLQTGCRSGAHALRFEDESPTGITIAGAMSLRCEGVSLRRAVMKAPDFAYGTFVDNFRRLGGFIGGHLRLAPTPADARLLFAYESLTLGEVIRLVNKFSINPMARGLLLSLAAEKGGAPGTLAKGAAAVSDWLGKRGIADCADLVIDNGSGLSRTSKISAACMNNILIAAARSRYFPELAASLPLGGEDGTLKHRFRETKGAARVRMKTGHLRDVAALTGFASTDGGRTLAISIMINHTAAEYGDGDRVIDALVRWAMDH